MEDSIDAEIKRLLELKSKVQNCSSDKELKALKKELPVRTVSKVSNMMGNSTKGMSNEQRANYFKNMAASGNVVLPDNLRKVSALPDTEKLSN